MKKSFVLYHDQFTTIKKLTKKQKGELLELLYLFNMGEELPERDPIVDIVFSMFESTFSRDNSKYLERCEKNKNNAKKRWDAKDTNVCDRMQSDAKHADSDNDKIVTVVEDSDKKKEPSPAKPEDTKKADRERIIKYLNAKLGTGYKPNAAKSATPINTRLSEGFTAEDFKTVIDDRVSIWINDAEMQKFLRPETLFGSKFEGYLQNTKIQTTPASKQPLDLNRDRTDEY